MFKVGDVVIRKPEHRGAYLKEFWETPKIIIRQQVNDYGEQCLHFEGNATEWNGCKFDYAITKVNLGDFL